jgi:uncharacterized membrane protein
MGGQIPVFYKQARQMKLESLTFGTNFFESHSEIRAAEGSMDGAVFANTHIKPEFRKRYAEEYGNDSQLAFGAPAYELAMTIGKLFNKQEDTLTSEEIMRKFHSLEENTGIASGPWRVINSKEHGKYVKFPLAIKKISENGYHEITENNSE